MDAASLDAIANVADAAEVLLWSGTGEHADVFGDRWVAYTGGSADAWLERDWRSAVHADDRARCELAWTAALHDGRGADIAVRLRGADGSYAAYLVRFVVAAERWFGVARELATPIATRAPHVSDHFLAAVSHELRAPIAAVLLWERLLREHDLGDDDRIRALDAIRHSAATQARLVDDLIDVARATAGKLDVRLTPVELAPILEHAVDAVRPLAAAKQLALDVDVASALGCVEGDAARLSQIVENVLVNAIKFTPERGRVALAAFPVDGSIAIEVVDNGRGIAPELLPHVFEAFRQLDDPDGPPDGLGLGLAIASELVALHHGSIEADSEGRGRGARFRILIPATEKMAPQAMRAGQPRALVGVKILVVDDDPRVLAALELLLERAGGQVTSARSVDAAWEAIEREPPDLVVSDLAMPIADGYELVRRLRSAHSQARFVPAIALTARAGTNEAERALAAGFDGYLAKPIEIDVLIASIVRLVHAPAAPHTR